MILFVEDPSSFRESYIYSDENDLEWEYEQSIIGTLPSPSSKSADHSFGVTLHSTPSQTRIEPSHNQNRFSIVSTSTMTSGIVSDKTCVSTENSQGSPYYPFRAAISLSPFHFRIESHDLLSFAEDLLLTSSTHQSSCDSLLAPKPLLSLKTRTVTVQRAVSEPSKKFEQLRLQVRNLPQCLPRRAISDETVDDHDYENISVVRQTLGLHAAGKRRTQSSASHQFMNRSPVTSGQSSPRYLSPHHSQLMKTPRKLSLTPNSAADHPALQHRYSLISSSPSMEQLLISYTPPPSYNESHARQRDMLMAGGRAASQESTHSLNNLPVTSGPTATSPSPSTSPAVTAAPVYHAASSSLTVESPKPPAYQKRQSSMPSTDPISHVTQVSTTTGTVSTINSFLYLSNNLLLIVIPAAT